jgi:hypothetical protein
MNSFPFKGKGTLEAEQGARVGMGWCFDPTLIPAFPLKGKEWFRGCNERNDPI